MRVLFYLADQNPHRDRSLGITGYSAGLLDALRRHDGLALEAVCSRSSFRPGAEVRVTTLPFRTDHSAGRLLSDHGVAALRARPDLWHFPKGHLPLVRPAGPCIGTVHDTILLHYAEHYPQTRSALAFAYWKTVLLASFARFDRICTVSHHARTQIATACERAGIATPTIDVTYEGARWEEHAGTALTAEARGEHVLHLGSVLPHKRSLTLLRHWQALQQRGRELPPLRIVGELAPEPAALARSLRRVAVEPRATGEALRDTLRTARALLVPSEIEGFGLPALEAAYLGTPVVYTRGTALDEVMQGFAAGGFALEDADGLDAALDAALALSTDELAKLGREARERFAWARCAEATVASYRATLARG